VTWVIVTRDAYAAWEATTSPDAETGVWIEYLVLPYLEPLTVVIRRYR